jgi:hypothetical protein
VRIDHYDVGRTGPLAQLLDFRAHVTREEGGVRKPVQLRVLDRAGDGLLGGFDPQTVSA